MKTPAKILTKQNPCLSEKSQSLQKQATSPIGNFLNPTGCRPSLCLVSLWRKLCSVRSSVGNCKAISLSTPGSYCQSSSFCLNSILPSWMNFLLKDFHHSCDYGSMSYLSNVYLSLSVIIHLIKFFFSLWTFPFLSLHVLSRDMPVTINLTPVPRFETQFQPLN